jgi:hypothetical protein
VSTHNTPGITSFFHLSFSVRLISSGIYLPKFEGDILCLRGFAQLNFPRRHTEAVESKGALRLRSYLVAIGFIFLVAKIALTAYGIIWWNYHKSRCTSVIAMASNLPPAICIENSTQLTTERLYLGIRQDLCFGLTGVTLYHSHNCYHSPTYAVTRTSPLLSESFKGLLPDRYRS